MAIGATKNSQDPWLRFKVWDIQGTGYLNQYVLIEWVSDAGLFANPAARTYFNSWPFDQPTTFLATQYLTNVPAYIYVPQDSWRQLSVNRVLYYRMSFGATQNIGPGWTFYPAGQLIINHPPIANPGPPRVLNVDPNDRLIDPLQLDGSGSVDDDMATSLGALRDSGPLSFTWEVMNGPDVKALPWQSANFNQAKPIALPANTAFHPSALGSYTFLLTVQDTDTPLQTSSPGIDYDQITHTVQRLGGGVLIYSPTGYAPRTFQLSEDLDVPITYRVDPGLLIEPAFAGGYWAELTILESTVGGPVVTRLAPVPPTDIEGHFSWDGIFDDFAQPASGQQFDIRIRLLDYQANPVTIPGRQLEDYQYNAIRINVTNIAIQPTATKCVDIDKLLAGTVQVSLPIQVITPPGARAPNTLELEVLDVNNAVLATLPVAGVPGQVTWTGSLGGGGRVTVPAHYRFRILARAGGTILARSNIHDVKVVRPELEITSPNQSAVGGRTVHAITFAAPAMPQLLIRMHLRGLTPDEDLQQVRDVRLVVEYVHGNRNDVQTVPGPTVNDWQTIPAGTNQFIPIWRDFWGGDLRVFSRALIDGVMITKESLPNSLVIWGENPPKANIRAGHGTNIQVVFHRESRFTQFSETANVGTLNLYRLGPLTVLHTFDDGIGIGQLTAPIPTGTQVWNWTANVAQAVQRLNHFRAQALIYQNQVQNGLAWTADTGGNPPNPGVAYPAAPNFSVDQLDLEMWARYNGGFRYHNYDPVTNSWQRRLAAGADANTSLPYADALLAMRNQVDAGNFPAGW